MFNHGKLSIPHPITPNQISNCCEYIKRNSKHNRALVLFEVLVTHATVTLLAGKEAEA